MKKILFASIAMLSSFALTSCDDDYNDGIAGPLTSPEEVAQSVSFGTVSEVATINLAEVTADVVKVVNFSAPTATDAAASLTGVDLVANNTVYEITSNGEIASSELIALVEGLYGKRPVERAVPAALRAHFDASGQSIVVTSSQFNIKAIPEAPEIEAKYYLTGTINGWDNTNTTYELTNDGSDPYENPTFTLRIPAPEDGSNVEFKMTPESGLGGDWSKCLGATDEGKFAYNNGGGNFVITGVEGAKYYDITFNMLEGTWSYAVLKFTTFFYEIGNESGWGTSHALYGEEGKYKGYYYLDGEFKFKPNADDWNDDLEYVDGTTTSGSLVSTGGPNCPDPGAGFYEVYLDLNTMEYSLTKIESVSLIGGFNGWAADEEMTYNAEEGCWEVTTDAVSGEFKFRANHDWAINWGGDVDGLTQDGSNLNIEAGTYNFKLYLSYNGAHKVVITAQ